MEEKVLNDEQLEKVVGGSVEENATDPFICSVGTFSGFISKYAEGHIGGMFYLVSHDGDEYYYGQLRDSFEVEYTFSTERTQVMMCEMHNGVALKVPIELSGDDYYLYQRKDA